MQKLGLFGGLVLIIIIAVAAVMAGRMGETSHAYAKGTVVLAPELTAAAKGIHTLFIIASGPDKPMPLGAFRKTLSRDAEGAFYDFVLTKDNMQRMMGEDEWPAQFKLKARLDQDGSAGPDQPGDIVGEVFPVTLGQSDIEIRLTRKVE
jgi:hypothetical protein